MWRPAPSMFLHAQPPPLKKSIHNYPSTVKEMSMFMCASIDIVYHVISNMYSRAGSYIRKKKRPEQEVIKCLLTTYSSQWFRAVDPTVSHFILLKILFCILGGVLSLWYIYHWHANTTVSISSATHTLKYACLRDKEYIHRKRSQGFMLKLSFNWLHQWTLFIIIFVGC